MRRVVPAIAGILEQLELGQPRVVTRADIDAARLASSSPTTTGQAIRDLTEAGWLLGLKTRGVWEFAPGARAGAIGSGDPHVELRATLTKNPGLSVMLAAESAAWLQSLSARPPGQHALAVPRGFRVPPALSGYRSVRCFPRLPAEIRDGLPVMGVASLLVSMAARPSSYRDWPNVAEWLPDTVGRINVDDLSTELTGKTRATWMRTCHLVAHAGAKTLATELASAAPAGSGPFYLGPRDVDGFYDGRFEVMDSLVAGEVVDVQQARAMRDSGWEGDLDNMRASRSS